jgi:hypothetical protein
MFFSHQWGPLPHPGTQLPVRGYGLVRIWAGMSYPFANFIAKNPSYVKHRLAVKKSRFQAGQKLQSELASHQMRFGTCNTAVESGQTFIIERWFPC